MDLTDWVPWVLAAGNVASAASTGRRLIVGWPLLIVTQVGFVAYALATGQPGFVLQNVAMCTIGALNWRRWHVEARRDRRSVTAGASEPRPNIPVRK